MYKKLTVLRNYYATSDPDEFCFDKHKDAAAHDSFDDKVDDRIYMRDLLPQEHHNQQGHWRIVVEFIPTGKED